MTLLPVWAPNIHPVLIHFPIVLLVLAPLLDLGAILLKKQTWLSKNANLLYALAGLSVLVVYISGRLAADSVNIPTQAYTTLSTHANWALYTLILGGINGVFRGFQLFRKKAESPFQWYLIIPGLVVVLLLLFTADNGAKLVYAHGVGVTACEPEDQHKMSTMPAADHHEMEAKTAEHSHSGEMSPASAAQKSGVQSVDELEWVLGDAASVNLTAIQEHDESLLSLNLDQQEALFVLPGIYTNLEFVAKVNRDKFNGIVRLVHHVTNANNYDLLELNNATVKQGRMKNGKLITFDSGEYEAAGWVALKVVSTKGHFRGYVNQNLVTHGHGADLPPGNLGLYFQGSGLIKLTGMLGLELE
ncbi:MAG: DUF2231 domain-containing protein [Candidatus Marinimicrobia bacterium]|nr:DUF2231 domain-containing protein [Candidatus Neomarinimicrobiota bacterium]